MYGLDLNLVPTLINVCSYYSVAIFCKLGANGFIASIVLVILMLLTQVIGAAFLVDKVIKLILILCY